MLEYQRLKLFEQFGKDILKLDTFLLKLVGYNPQESRLKIGDYLLHCSPATFRINGCSLVLFLGKSEVEHFKEYEKKLISFGISFDGTYFGSSVSFYIKGRMVSLNMMRENVYLLDFSINNPPNSYIEVFLYLSNINSIYKKLYSTKLTAEQSSGIQRFPVYKAQIFKDGVLICHGTIASLSLRHIEFDLRSIDVEMEMDKEYKYIILYNGRGINLIGKVVKALPNQYISSIDFNLEFIHIMSKYLGVTQEEEEVEDLEEL